MRIAVGVLVALATTAHADPQADELTAQGEQLAKDGEFSRAIEAFKEADAKAPSARHACLIGLAYTRRELWSQAELFFDRCKARATGADPLPDWFTAAETQLADKLKGVDTAAVDIRTTPADAPAVLSVSSFAPDETFAPRTIHLTPGTYVINGSVPGQPPVTETVTVKLGADNVVTLHFKEPPRPMQPPPPPPPPTTAARSQLPRYLLLGAGGAAVLGIGMHVLAYHERSTLQSDSNANDLDAYNSHRDSFELARGATIGLYGAAVIAAGVGIALRMRDERAPVVTGALTPGGALVGIEVRR